MCPSKNCKGCASRIHKQETQSTRCDGDCARIRLLINGLDRIEALWVETRITLRWLTRFDGNSFEPRSYEIIRFVKCAKRTIEVRSQRKCITLSRSSPYRMNLEWDSLCLTITIYKVSAIRATPRYIGVLLVIRKRRFRRIISEWRSVLLKDFCSNNVENSV